MEWFIFIKYTTSEWVSAAAPGEGGCVVGENWLKELDKYIWNRFEYICNIVVISYI